MITNLETMVSVATWFEWLNNVVNFVPKSIIINCSTVEINAIYEVYGNAVQVLLCHWGIKRAWEKNITKYVSEHTFITVSNEFIPF